MRCRLQAGGGASETAQCMTFASGTALCAIEGARQSDLANIRWLLSREGLTSADITEHAGAFFGLSRRDWDRRCGARERATRN